MRDPTQDAFIFNTCNYQIWSQTQILSKLKALIINWPDVMYNLEPQKF